MTNKLMTTSCVLALPLALALTSPLARADEGQKDTQSKAASKTVTTTKSGNTVTRDATVTHADGTTRTSTDTWIHDGNTVKHEGETTLANGKTETRQSVATKDGNTTTRDATRVNPNGGTTQAHSVRTREGDTATTQTTRTHTGPEDPQHKKHHPKPPKGGANGNHEDAPKR